MGRKFCDATEAKNNVYKIVLKLNKVIKIIINCLHPAAQSWCNLTLTFINFIYQLNFY